MTRWNQLKNFSMCGRASRTACSSVSATYAMTTMIRSSGTTVRPFSSASSRSRAEGAQLVRDRHEHDRVAEVVVDGQRDGLLAAGADDEALRPRLLKRLRPRVQVAVVVELAVVAERPVLGPRLEDDVEPLAEARARGGRVDRALVRPVLHAGAERERVLHPPARHHVEHRVLLGHAIRVLQVDRRAGHLDLRVRRDRAEPGRHQAHGRGHAVDHAVVLVDRDAVEAELVGADHRAQVAVVELVAPDRVVERVREVDHRGPVLRVVLRNVDVVMVVEEVELDVVEGRSSRRHLLCPGLSARSQSQRCAPSHERARARSLRTARVECQLILTTLCSATGRECGRILLTPARVARSRSSDRPPRVQWH